MAFADLPREMHAVGLLGSILVNRTKRVRVAMCGNLVPRLNPIRAAEEYRKLDVISGVPSSPTSCAESRTNTLEPTIRASGKSRREKIASLHAANLAVAQQYEAARA
ncbi:MAG: hypothetical protein ACREFQ_17385 [Stellaceae bacterium]